MKRTFIIFIVITLLFVVLPCFGDYTTRTSWEEQIHGMGYLILHLSSINAINGMNLTPDQARRLRQMAHEVEAVSERVPDFETIYRPDLAEVRDTYLEVRKYIISGKEVPGELEQRVVRARSIESAVIRLSLSNKKFACTSCLQCHREPGINDLRQDNRIMASLKGLFPKIQSSHVKVGKRCRFHTQRGNSPCIGTWIPVPASLSLPY